MIHLKRQNLLYITKHVYNIASLHDKSAIFELVAFEPIYGPFYYQIENYDHVIKITIIYYENFKNITKRTSLEPAHQQLQWNLKIS